MLQCCTAGSSRLSLTGCSLPEDELFGWQKASQVMWCMYSGCNSGAPRLCCSMFIERQPWSRNPGGLRLHSSCLVAVGGSGSTSDPPTKACRSRAIASPAHVAAKRPFTLSPLPQNVRTHTGQHTLRLAHSSRTASLLRPQASQRPTKPHLSTKGVYAVRQAC